jgi:Fe-S cluster assembly ATP-binding protein
MLSTEKKAKKGLFLSLQHVPKIGGVTLTTFLHKAYVATRDSDTSVLEFYVTLRDIAERFGIDTALLDRPLTAGLSGGEKKLSEVLQLAALKPRFAILDEIDSGVDVDALKKVFAAVRALALDGMGFLIISHHPSILEHLTPKHVHVMNAGTLARSGGVELADAVLSGGYCKVLNCPLEGNCHAKQTQEPG